MERYTALARQAASVPMLPSHHYSGLLGAYTTSDLLRQQQPTSFSCLMPAPTTSPSPHSPVTSSEKQPADINSKAKLDVVKADKGRKRRRSSSRDQPVSSSSSSSSKKPAWELNLLAPSSVDNTVLLRPPPSLTTPPAVAPPTEIRLPTQPLDISCVKSMTTTGLRQLPPAAVVTSCSSPSSSNTVTLLRGIRAKGGKDNNNVNPGEKKLFVRPFEDDYDNTCSSSKKRKHNILQVTAETFQPQQQLEALPEAEKLPATKSVCINPITVNNNNNIIIDKMPKVRLVCHYR